MIPEECSQLSLNGLLCWRFIIATDAFKSRPISKYAPPRHTIHVPLPLLQLPCYLPSPSYSRRHDPTFAAHSFQFHFNFLPRRISRRGIPFGPLSLRLDPFRKVIDGLHSVVKGKWPRKSLGEEEEKSDHIGIE